MSQNMTYREVRQIYNRLQFVSSDNRWYHLAKKFPSCLPCKEDSKLFLDNALPGDEADFLVCFISRDLELLGEGKGKKIVAHLKIDN